MTARRRAEAGGSSAYRRRPDGGLTDGVPHPSPSPGDSLADVGDEVWIANGNTPNVFRFSKEGSYLGYSPEPVYAEALAVVPEPGTTLAIAWLSAVALVRLRRKVVPGREARRLATT